MRQLDAILSERYHVIARLCTNHQSSVYINYRSIARTDRRGAKKKTVFSTYPIFYACAPTSKPNRIDMPICMKPWSRVDINWPVNSVNHLVLFSVKTNCPNIYKRPTRFAIFRSDSINICKLHTCFLGDKMESHNFYKPPTGFAVVKTDSPNINKPPTSFPVVKQTPRTSITLQHVLW